MTCGECGQEHTRGGHPTCTGHVIWDRATYVPGQPRRTRQRLPQPRACMNHPAPGQVKCRMHGAGSAKVKAKGAKKVAEEKAERLLRRFGGPADTTPTEALLDTVRWTAGYVAWLREKIAGAESDRDLTQHSAVTGKSEPSVWLDLLGQWHDRLVRICAEAIKAGIEERRVRLAESQGQLVADVIRRILGDLDLTVEQQQRVGTVVPLHLRRLAS